MNLSRWLFAWVLGVAMLFQTATASAEVRHLAYLVSDARIPFWVIMKRGIESRAAALGYRVDVYSAQNDARLELEHAIKAINEKVDGIILSPTNSSAAVTVLQLAKAAHIPVVIADIGADAGDYVSYIASDNSAGAYQLGKTLVHAMQPMQDKLGRIGIIAIPQKRENGRARTDGFMQALREAGVPAAEIYQQVDFSYRETYEFSKQLIAKHPDLRAIWLQGSDRYQAALDAIKHSGKTGNILLICFDAEPAFIDMIKRGVLVGAGMQQPYLIGELSVTSLRDHLANKPVPKKQQVPVLVVNQRNIRQLLPTIQRNVLGLMDK